MKQMSVAFLDFGRSALGMEEVCVARVVTIKAEAPRSPLLPSTYEKNYFAWEVLCVNECTDVLAFEHAFQVANDVHVKHIDRQLVFLAHSGGCDVHHTQTA